MGSRPWQSAALKRVSFFFVLHAGRGVEGPFCHLGFCIGGVRCLAFCPARVAKLDVCLCVLKAVSVALCELAISNKSHFSARVSASEEQS